MQRCRKEGPPVGGPSLLTHCLKHALLLLATIATSPTGTLAQATPAAVQVVDAATAKPIPYASVGVPHKALGTVANATGQFALTQTGAAATDTLLVSCVGYVPQRVLARQLGPVVKLVPQAQPLREVVVRGARPRPVVLGHRGVSSFTSYSFYTQADTVPHARLGREFGTVLRVQGPTQLVDFHVFTFGQPFKTVTFRLNIYAVRDGLPQQSLLTRDVLFSITDPQRHWTTVDLRPYAISLAGPQQVVATLQWVASEKNDPAARFFSIPAHLSATHTSFMRDKSAQAWRKFSVNPSMYFTGLQDAQ